MAGSAISSRAHRRPGYAIWGMTCLVIAVTGFWPTYIAPSIAGTYASVAGAMPLHVFFTSLWLLLIVSQPLLVQGDKLRLHRRVGVAGALAAIGEVLTGVVVQIQVMGPYAARGDEPNAVVTPFFRLVTMLIYAIGVGSAIALRGRPAWHKRLMLLATFSLLEAPLGRIFANIMGLGDVSGLLAAIGHVLLMVLFLVWDRRVHGRFHSATVWGAVLSTVIVFWDHADRLHGVVATPGCKACRRVVRSSSRGHR